MYVRQSYPLIPPGGDLGDGYRWGSVGTHLGDPDTAVLGDAQVSAAVPAGAVFLGIDAGSDVRGVEVRWSGDDRWYPVTEGCPQLVPEGADTFELRRYWAYALDGDLVVAWADSCAAQAVLRNVQPRPWSVVRGRIVATGG